MIIRGENCAALMLGKYIDLYMSDKDNKCVDETQVISNVGVVWEKVV